MAVQNQDTKVAVSVSEMARMVGLSRARLYQLQNTGAFPKPTYDHESGRPYYDERQQVIRLDVRRTNCGCDGRPILFYARRATTLPPTPAARKTTESKTHSDVHDKQSDVLEAVKALGLAAATMGQVGAALAGAYPTGIEGIDEGEVIRSVFLLIKRQDRSDNLRR